MLTGTADSSSFSSEFTETWYGVWGDYKNDSNISSAIRALTDCCHYNVCLFIAKKEDAAEITETQETPQVLFQNLISLILDLFFCVFVLEQC